MVAQPSLVFDAAYFNGATDANGAVYGYTNYVSPLTYLDERPNVMAARYVERLAAAGKTVLIVGCALGLTVQELRLLGVQAWGLDVSSYAVNAAPAAVRQYLTIGDARQSSAWNAAKNLAGFKGQTRFNMVITEDLLPCLSNADAVTMAQLARANSQAVFHLYEDNPATAPWYNYHTPAEWKAILGQDKIVRRYGWEVT